ncbi:MAG: DcaP family trimeric outer membrane transporter, partial [Polyangiales bacterium]
MRWRLYSTLLLAVLCLGVSIAVAQSPEDPEALRRELAAERARLEEQMKRLDELEARLDAALAEEQAAPDAAPTTEGEEVAAGSEDIVPERLDKEPNQTKDSHEVLTGDELMADDFPGSWPMFGTNYRMKFGGYFKLDALYDFDGAGDRYQFLVAQIPVEGSPEAAASGYFNMFVRDTRINFDIRSSGQDGVPQQFFLEMDFFDTSSYSPRLRHAYIVYGNLLVGQTWTTIAEMASLPFTIDFGGGDALFGNRTPQVRWQQDLNSTWSWAVGLEQLQTSGIYNPDDLGGSASPQLPVLAGRLTHQRSNGIRTLAALLQQLHWDGEGVGPDATAAGWALIFAGRQNFGGSRDFFTWNLVYGDGTADTIMALTGSDANANLTPDGRLVTRQGYSVALG